MQTESFESFNAYSTALDSYDKGEYEESQAYLEKAVEIDEDFEIAWDRLDELEKYLEDMLLSRSLGLGEYYINLINSLNYDDPNSCNNFIASMNGKILINQIHQAGLQGDLYTHLKNGYQRTYKEHQWKLYGFTKMHVNLEEFFVEYGKVKGEIINFYDQIIFGNYPDRKCGSFNPKERCINNILGEIIHLQLTYYQTGVAINKDGMEFFNLNHAPMDDPLWYDDGEDFLKVGDSATHYYNKQFIKYGELLYKKYPNTNFTQHLDFLQKAIELEK